MPRSKLRVTIGFDYGTHSVKCVLRTRHDDRAMLLEFGNAMPEERYPWFAEPSVIRMLDGQLWFGRKALERQGGELWRSLKMRLLHPNGMLLESNSVEAPLNVDVIIAAHIANVLQRINRVLEATYGRSHEILLALNVGAPMNHFVNQELHDRYLQIMNAAWQLTFGESKHAIKNGVVAAEIVPLICSLMQLPVADANSRPFKILPETVAPIVSMSKDPSMSPGLYTMMDMGAGTTEMSVVFVADRTNSHQVSCFFDESYEIGGNSFSGMHSPGSEDNDIKCAEMIRRLLEKITCRSFQNDAPNRNLRSKWSNLTLLYTGGGSRHAAVQASSRRMTNALKPFEIGDQYFDCCWHTPCFAGYEDDLNELECSLLAVANGLSYHSRDWPEFHDPTSLRPETPLERIEKPEAGWYVND